MLPHQRQQPNATSPANAFLDFPSLAEQAEPTNDSLSSMPPPPKPINTATAEEEQNLSLMIPDSNELMQQSLCEKHFPEPIIYMSDEPLCRKCIPEQMERLKTKMSSGSEDGAMSNVANLLGFSLPSQQNLY